MHALTEQSLALHLIYNVLSSPLSSNQSKRKWVSGPAVSMHFAQSIRNNVHIIFVVFTRVSAAKVSKKYQKYRYCNGYFFQNIVMVTGVN